MASPRNGLINAIPATQRLSVKKLGKNRRSRSGESRKGRYRPITPNFIYLAPFTSVHQLECEFLRFKIGDVEVCSSSTFITPKPQLRKKESEPNRAETLSIQNERLSLALHSSSIVKQASLNTDNREKRAVLP